MILYSPDLGLKGDKRSLTVILGKEAECHPQFCIGMRRDHS
jgi:hypothetical protein